MHFAIAPVLFFSLSLKRGLSVMPKSAKKGYRITGLRRMAGLLGAVACVIARCCVRDSIISEQPGVVLAGAPR